ncbi:MAG: hypothetical protein FWD61_06455 [Phycisphaerales bacterium]|nr:hypothetical protein [Phycisphaerales bacterium]
MNALAASSAESLAGDKDDIDPRIPLQRYIRHQLLALGVDTAIDAADTTDTQLLRSLMANYRQKTRLLKNVPCPADASIEEFLNQLCRENHLPADLRLPREVFNLSAAGLARELSLPMDGETFENAWLKSYRLQNGVLHNPRSDRRTTKGTFHVAEVGLPVPGDKVAMPFSVFVELFRHALNAPQDLLMLPFTALDTKPTGLFCSLLLRPIVCPEIPNVRPAQSMEIRFFAPGSLVSNLDFIESIFGNAGDPVLPENDARLDVEHWTGHTGCVILAPHLVNLTKKELGLPHYDQATERQRRDGACWKHEDERYNNGQAFKITCRSADGIMVTLIADNYYGYCKKEVKTQISFAANLMGQCEEEHSGGALAFASYSLGMEYEPSSAPDGTPTLAELAAKFPDLLELHAEGHAVDRRFPQLIYIPADAGMDLRTGTVHWRQNGEPRTIPLLLDHIYMAPTGVRFFLNRHPGSGRFRIIMTMAQGTFCHKPCTVSGGGKSEISKSLIDYMIYGPIYVSDLEKDLDQVEVIFQKDHAIRWKPGHAPFDYSKSPSRPILDVRRSLGSVIKLMTPSPDYTDEYNHWLTAIPSDILSLIFLIKRLYKPEWGNQWRKHFTVDIVNGEPGHELKADDRKAGGTYLRVGLLPNAGWRTFKVRQDFYPAAKISMEDDITASVVTPANVINPSAAHEVKNSAKLVINCESQLFQRPDDAIHPGLDHQTESDFTRMDNFFSNYEPLTPAMVRDMVNHVSKFDEFSAPMQQFLHSATDDTRGYVACSANPRLVDGKPSKNPRYLQLRPDLARPFERHIAETGVRLSRNIPLNAPLAFPVDAILIGRRNNPPEPKAKIRNLAVYNPIHYQELPEFLMDVICSLTGKSPSTTGAGSEGALTKGPFNALLTTADLNAAIVSMILTGLHGFSTAAGHIGPNVRVDHDISLLVPELWCRLSAQERDPAFLITNGYLEKINDFTHNGQNIPASRLGYRINYKFVRAFFGRIFDNPARVFDDTLLRPETQDMEAYVDGIRNITEAQERVARQYFEDGSISQACPPLAAILHIMTQGNYQGHDVHHPELRQLFTRESLLASDWYANRLRNVQQLDQARWQRFVHYLTDWSSHETDTRLANQLNIPSRLALAQRELTRTNNPAYLKSLEGTLGADRLN